MKNNKKLIIVSDSLPVGFAKEDKGLVHSLKGLPSVMDGFLSNKEAVAALGIDEVLWVGIAHFNVKDWQTKKYLAKNLPYQIKPLFIPPQLKTDFKEGFTQSSLLPLLLYRPSFATFKPEWYEAYKTVNQLFLKKINQIANKGDIVWVHDYPLALLPEHLRQEHKDLSIGYFLHTPFPSYEIIKTLPQKWYTEILRGMLGADMIGFQTGDYVQHFERAIENLLGKEQSISRNTRYDKFPISIDFEKYNHAYGLPKVIELRKTIKAQFHQTKMILSLDALGFNSNCINKIKAFELLLEKYPSWQRLASLMLIIKPSLQDFDKNIGQKQEIETLIQQINKKYATKEWQPIVYEYDFLDFETRSAFYTAADIALMIPLREGMNLRAKEFVATRFDQQGVLILSDMTGAAQELRDAVLAHPTDIEDLVEKIRTALLMSPEEQVNRLKAMQMYLYKNNNGAWATDFITQLEKVKKNDRSLSKRLLLDNKNQLLRDVKLSKKRLFLLDYDGTLNPIRTRPEVAKPSRELLFLLKILAKNPNNHIVLMSERQTQNLEDWFGELPITLVAENGVLIRYRRTEEWQLTQEIKSTWKPRIRTLLEEYTNRSEGAQIEEKDYSMTWHYNRVDSDTAQLRSRQLIAELLPLARRHNLRVIDCKSSVEIQSNNINKGVLVKKLLQDFDYDFIMAIGDDVPDEVMFHVLSDITPYTIHVGQKDTEAHFNIPAYQWVIALLESIVGLNDKERDAAFLTLAHIM